MQCNFTWGTALQVGRSRVRFVMLSLKFFTDIILPIVQEAGWASGPVWTGAKNLAPPGFDPRTVQPVGSRYTDWAIAAYCFTINCWSNEDDLCDCLIPAKITLKIQFCQKISDFHRSFDEDWSSGSGRIMDCVGPKPLNAQLNPICHLLALLEARHILHVSRMRVKLPVHNTPIFNCMEASLPL